MNIKEITNGLQDVQKTVAELKEVVESLKKPKTLNCKTCVSCRPSDKSKPMYIKDSVMWCKSNNLNYSFFDIRNCDNYCVSFPVSKSVEIIDKSRDEKEPRVEGSGQTCAKCTFHRVPNLLYGGYSGSTVMSCLARERNYDESTYHTCNIHETKEGSVPNYLSYDCKTCKSCRPPSNLGANFHDDSVMMCTAIGAQINYQTFLTCGFYEENTRKDSIELLHCKLFGGNRDESIKNNDKLCIYCASMDKPTIFKPNFHKESVLYCHKHNTHYGLTELDPCSAYDENIKEEVTPEIEKPLRWRAKIGQRFWHLTQAHEIVSAFDHYGFAETCKYKDGNYFQSRQHAIDYKVAQEIQFNLERFSDYITPWPTGIKIWSLVYDRFTSSFRAVVFKFDVGGKYGFSTKNKAQEALDVLGQGKLKFMMLQGMNV